MVADVSSDFELYWTSASAQPARAVLPAASTAALALMTETAARVEGDPAATSYLEALRGSALIQDLMTGSLRLEWADVHMVSDDPAKGLGRPREDQLLWTRLKQVLGMPKRSLHLVSPYFVPGSRGVQDLTSFARQGTSVRILTNALESTDVAAVHAGYARRRRPLLAAGIELFELKRSAGAPSARGRTVAGSSASSLHAKTFAVDDERLFVGSFNFDPRSQRLNTELGFVIDCSAMARAFADEFRTTIPARAYRVTTHDGGMRWEELHEGKTLVFDSEPQTSTWQRVLVAALSLLPIEWLL